MTQGNRKRRRLTQAGPEAISADTNISNISCFSKFTCETESSGGLAKVAGSLILGGQGAALSWVRPSEIIRPAQVAVTSAASSPAGPRPVRAPG